VSPLSHIKLGLATAGVILFAYGVRAELPWLRWAGIAFLAVAAVLRFWGRRRSRDDERRSDNANDGGPDE
jgi:hypothetical protein